MKKRTIALALILSTTLGLTACGHKHTLSTATCTTPATCTECGEQVGSISGHSYSVATCTTPEICTVCGAQNGTAIGHTTDFGKCSNCNEVQGKDIVDSLKDEYDTIFYKSELLFSKLNYVNDYYSTFTSMASGYKEFSQYYNNMIELCGDYPELSSLKSACSKAKNALPTSVAGSSQSDLNSYLDDLEDYAYEEANVGIELSSVEDKLD